MPPRPSSSSSEALRCSTSAGESLARRRPAAPAAPPPPPHGLAHGRRYRDAYEAFRSLHRLDRDWPFLLEWLVRSKSHWLREAGHLASQGPVPRIVGRPPPAPGSPPPAPGSPPAATGGAAGGAAGGESADTVAAAAQRAKVSPPR